MLKKFSEVAKDGCCPKCGYAIMKRGANTVTSNLAVGMAAALATGGLLEAWVTLVLNSESSFPVEIAG
jgi:hypothetical protein